MNTTENHVLSFKTASLVQLHAKHVLENSDFHELNVISNATQALCIVRDFVKANQKEEGLIISKEYLDIILELLAYFL
jgi:energy-converting hydrogenase A subunit M